MAAVNDVSSSDIRVELLPDDARRGLPADSSGLGFGKVITNHMFCLDYEREGGWQDPRIVPYAPFQLDPAALVLHYAQTIFEGMKAFGGPGEDVILFRPDQNAGRFYRSAERICIPPVPVDMFLQAVEEVVKVERAWVPRDPGTALYIRPTLIATEPGLGVRPASQYLFYVLLSPVGPYFPEGFQPIELLISDEHVRAVRGGVGEAKTGGNYAASLLAGQVAASRGYSQVLYLDAVEHKYIEEVGAMNMMFVFEGKTIATSPLTGSILPGVTRATVLQLGPDLGYEVEERMLDVNEVLEGIRSGRVTEVFGTGTAASIAPVGALAFKDQVYAVGDRQIGPIAQTLYDTLQGIQYGRSEDPHGWTVRI